MSKGFIPMMITTLGAVGIYYYWSMVLKLNDTAGMVLGVLSAVIISALFVRLKKKRK